MEDCVEVSREFARRASEELHIPMYAAWSRGRG